MRNWILENSFNENIKHIKVDIKLILCGYHKIGCDILEKIVTMNYFDDIFLFTHAPGNAVPDIRKKADELNIRYSEKSINKSKLPFKPDVISSIYYRYIIKQHVIDSCDGKIFNVHPSLLPNHKGCSAVPWAIIEGDQYSGITFHYIDKNIDTGNIILQITTQIKSNETQKSLYDRLMNIGSKYWEAAFKLVDCGFMGYPQHGESKYHIRGVPNNGEIDESWDEKKIKRFINAMIYPPYAPATYRGKDIFSYEDFKKIESI